MVLSLLPLEFQQLLVAVVRDPDVSQVRGIIEFWFAIICPPCPEDDDAGTRVTVDCLELLHDLIRAFPQ